MVICEEMAFMQKPMFDEVIIPLLGMRRTKLIGITTPSPDDHNFFTRMLNLKIPGTDKNAFGTLVIDLACDECKRRNRAAECRHMQNLLPQWKGSDKFELAALLYGEADRDIHLRENMGITSAAQDKLFDSKWIDYLRKRPVWSNLSGQTRPTHIFISIDPNSQGSSHMAIVSIAMINSEFVIVGIDSHPTHTAEQAETLLRHHLERIRSDPFLTHAFLVLVSEKNTGFEATYHWRIVSCYPPSIPIYGKIPSGYEGKKPEEIDDLDPGVDTTYQLKNNYGRTLSYILLHRRLHFYERCIVANPYWSITDTAERAEAIKTELCAQLANCRKKYANMDVTNASIGTQVSHVTWSGKIGANGKIIKGQNDDLVMGLAQNLFWIIRIHQMNFPGFPYDRVFQKNQQKLLKVDAYGIPVCHPSGKF